VGGNRGEPGGGKSRVRRRPAWAGRSRGRVAAWIPRPGAKKDPHQTSSTERPVTSSHKTERAQLEWIQCSGAGGLEWVPVKSAGSRVPLSFNVKFPVEAAPERRRWNVGIGNGCRLWAGFVDRECRSKTHTRTRAVSQPSSPQAHPVAAIGWQGRVENRDQLYPGWFHHDEDDAFQENPKYARQRGSETRGDRLATLPVAPASREQMHLNRRKKGPTVFYAEGDSQTFDAQLDRLGNVACRPVANRQAGSSVIVGGGAGMRRYDSRRGKLDGYVSCSE